MFNLHNAIDWDAIDRDKYRDERAAVADLLGATPLNASERLRVVADAAKLVEATRAAAGKQGVVESFLAEFSLGSREGTALMCLAEALLRTPDAATRDRLIAEKIGTADWASHLGQSDSLFVNASTWGLMLTGKLIDVDEDAKRDLGGWLARLTARVGEPIVRTAVGSAVRMMGEQFVLGRTIDAALKRAAKENYLCSFDMLGEGARTTADATRYETIYADAIDAVGRARGPGLTPEDGHGVSVKLSALCPRYEAVQEARVWAELYPRLKRLALIAAHHDLNLAIDAEEADRLVLSLKLIERLAHEPELGAWQGLGVVVQGYQKRGRGVIERLQQLAQSSGRRIMVRLVKGAYWDSEIKRAQIAGRPDYPVFTTKAATDLSYLVCAEALIAASPALYPQFATHNAHTLAAVRLMAARAGVRIEYQRLHGMGEALYAAAGNERLRAYAPVGGHEELLPYLVRRLLENGANTSFVHALLDENVPALQVVRDPIADVEAQLGPHPKLPKPGALYGAERANPPGRDYSMASDRDRARAASAALVSITAGPIVGGRSRTSAAVPVCSPVDGATIGTVAEATSPDIDRAAGACTSGAAALGPTWRHRPGGRLARNGRCARSRDRPARRLAGAGSGQDAERWRRRSARGYRLLPLLRAVGRAPVRHARGVAGTRWRDQQPRVARARNLRLHLAVELPAGDLHRPDRGGAGGGECSDWPSLPNRRRLSLPKRFGCSTPPGLTPICSRCCRATARPSAVRLSATR